MAESPRLPELPQHDRPALSRRIIGLVFGAAVIILVGMAVLWHHSPGKSVRISDKERVYYSDDATEELARALGAALQEAGWFTGQRQAAAFVRKTARDGTIVALVTDQRSWQDSQSDTFFTALGRRIAPSVGGPPITLQLMDGWRRVKKTFHITP